MVDVHWPAEKPSLRIAHTMFCQIDGLRFGFDAFGDHLEIERVRHFHNVQHDLASRSVGSDGLDKCLVDFERVERERLQARKAGVAAAKIVDGDSEALCAHRVEEFGGFGTLQESALGGFELDVFRASAGIAKKLIERMRASSLEPGQRLLPQKGSGPGL